MDTKTEHDAPETQPETVEEAPAPPPTREAQLDALQRLLMHADTLDKIWAKVTPELKSDLIGDARENGWATTVLKVVTNPKRFGKLRWTGLFSTKISKDARNELAAMLAELPPPTPPETAEPPAGSE